MSTSPTIPGIESLSLIVTQEIHVKASLETTFESLLEQIGPENETPEQKMPMKLEAWPFQPKGSHPERGCISGGARDLAWIRNGDVELGSE